jgi:hypothetical protein
VILCMRAWIAAIGHHLPEERFQDRRRNLGGRISMLALLLMMRGRRGYLA